jgi:type IV secretory pathway VirB2 component (pilin)
VLDTLTVAAGILAQVPDPGAGTPPPGSEGFLSILSWAAWIAFGVCVLGVIIAGAAMALGNRRGEGGEHAQRLGWVLAGCIVIGSASGFVGALV